jgi:hypothetical protein
VSYNVTYQRNEAAQSSLLVGRAGALEVFKGGGGTTGNLAVQSGESEIGRAALGVDEVLAGAVSLQREKRRGRGGNGGGGDSQGAKGEGEDAGGVHCGRLKEWTQSWILM